MHTLKIIILYSHQISEESEPIGQFENYPFQNTAFEISAAASFLKICPSMQTPFFVSCYGHYLLS